MGFKTNNALDRMVALKQTVDDGDDDQGQSNDGDTSGETSKAPTLTDEQWATLLDAMGLEEDSTADELVAAVTQLVDVVSEFEDQHDGKVSASAGDDDTVVLDKDRYQELMALSARGEKAKVDDLHREGDQLIRAKIKAGAIGAASHARWMNNWKADPVDTKARLSALKGGAIPREEVGHSASSVDDQDDQPTGWVV